MKAMLLTFMVTLLACSSSFAQSSSENQFQKYAEAKLNAIVQKIDSESFVILELKAGSNKVKLPNVPFVINQPELTGEKFELITVKVVARSNILSDKLKEIINSTIKAHAKKVEFSYQNISELKSKEVSSFWTTMTVSQKVNIATLSVIIIGLFGFFFVRKNEYNKTHGLVQETVEKLVSSIESNTNTKAKDFSSSSSGNKEKTQIEVNTSGNQFWENFPIEGLVSLISDCYWSYEDSYASFVWNHLSIAQRQEILERSSIENAYVKFLAGVESEDKHYISDPYYLDAISLNHINNFDLVELIEKNPPLLGMISKLRAQHIPLKAKDRIRLASDKEGEFDSNILSSINPSVARTLKSQERFSFESIEEENEIISISDVSMEIMEKYPSLGWILKLSDSEAKDLLEPYSAKDLADIWIAPSHVLSKLSSHISEKKYELLQSYLGKTEPSREHRDYEELISDALDILRKKDVDEVA